MTDRPHRQPPIDRSLESTLRLYEQARQGDSAALETIYARYMPRLNRWATGRLPARARGMQETGDLVQETLRHFMSKMQSFQPRHEGALMAYLCTSLRNRIHDIYRRKQRQPDRAEIDMDRFVSAEASPYEQCVERDVRERYHRALERLTEDERTAVILKVELALGPTELAEALGKSSPDAARMYTQRAIMKLAREMDDV